MTNFLRIRRTPTVRLTFLALSALVGFACAPALSRVHVEGDPISVSRLVGEWAGDYRSPETGRSGLITFRLKAGTDTAYGDVIMTYRPGDGGNVSGMEQGRNAFPASQILTVRFVVIQNADVVGILDPYADPVCGCSLQTRFQGKLNGNEIKGIFETRSSDIFHHTTTGEWNVRRVILRAASDAAGPAHMR